MKLNIYDKKKIIKTYEVDTYDVFYGTIEDISKVLKFDKLETGSDVEIIKMCFSAFNESRKIINKLFKDIFDGLTDDELKKTHVREMVDVVKEIVYFTFGQLNLGNNSKN